MRSLAEFVCRQGDLYRSSQGRQVEPEEGIQRQRQAQKKRLTMHPDYAAEVFLKTSFLCADQSRLLRGRMDGLMVAADRVVIEEFKCCAELPQQVDAVDRGQAWLYAGLYAHEHSAPVNFEVRVIYIHVDTTEERVFAEQASHPTVTANLAFLLLCYATRIEAHLARSGVRRSWADSLRFPLPEYRPAQQAIARRVYRALEHTENLLLEAPTGSGKTLAVLYPALKAQQLDDQLFFLTSRNAGARAALTAVRQLDAGQQRLVVVELTAKEKICFVPGMPCDAKVCPYAAGYFDRAATAVTALLATRLAHRAAIEATAEQHQVCPFELSLDTALWADLIIGDYNYIFDPMVRLQRFSNHDRLHLLIDEAHQLSPRVRSMLTVKVDRGWVNIAKGTKHAGLRKRVVSIDRALLSMRRAHGQGQHVLDSIDSLARACGRLLDSVAEHDIDLNAYPELRELVFAALGWRRSDAWYQPEQFVHHLTVSGRDINVTRACLDPASYMQGVFAEHGGVVRFSGTLTPLALYQRLHGQTGAAAERAQSPFRHEQTLVLVVRDIATYYKSRQQSMPRLAVLLREITAAKPGRYLVALPSYDYMQGLTQVYSNDSQTLFRQTRGQSNEETEALLEAFATCESAVLFVVMGGIYGESVDFSAASLSGVMMVGLGLPPPSLERNMMQAYFDAEEGTGWGRMVAYTQPALVKNIQAAGRLIRSPDDFGVICLVDPRFTSEQVQRFFPSHWQPQVTSAAGARQKVTHFWHSTLPQELPQEESGSS